MPPAFELTVVLARRERLLLGAWAGLSMGTLAGWLLAQTWSAAAEAPLPGWAVPAVALLAALPAAAGCWYASRNQAARIEWRDGVWHWRSTVPGAEPAVGRLEPMIDLGVWMLLRFRSPDLVRTGWLVVDRTQAAPHWHDLRAALFQPAGRAAGDA